MKSFLQQALHSVVEGGTLSAADMQRVVEIWLDEPNAPDALIGSLLSVLRMRGERAEEIEGATRALLNSGVQVVGLEDSIDTCGTGGDGQHTLNISTLAALVVASCGVSVVKHGNRSVSSKSGSADLVEAWGIPLQLPRGVDSWAEIHQRSGITFLFAPLMFPQMKRISPIRQALGLRTLFNLVGPLANPARPRRQLLGVADASLMQPMAEAATRLGAQSIWVVHGEGDRGGGGLDEMSIASVTHVIRVDQGQSTRMTLSPEDFGLRRYPIETLAVRDVRHSADIAQACLEGHRSAYSEAVILNAAAALCVGTSMTYLDAAARAREALEEKRTKAKLEQWKRALTI